MRGRIGRGEVHRKAAMREVHGNRRCQRSFADTAFTHQHDQAVAIGGDAFDQSGQIRRVEHGCVDPFGGCCRCCRGGQQLA